MSRLSNMVTSAAFAIAFVSLFEVSNIKNQIGLSSSKEEYVKKRNLAYRIADENKDMVLESDEMIKFAKELGVLPRTEVIPLGQVERAIYGVTLEQFETYIDKKANERSEELRRREK
ncbi:MAG: hypothetical protein AABW58_04900 [Nanoarchaeota archaeon]